MSFAVILLGIFLIIFAGAPGFYYFYMRRSSYRPWNVKKDEEYFPLLTVLVPVYNEQKIIRFKLENLVKLDYPRDKLQVIIADDGSTDGTVQAVHQFQKSNACMKIEVLEGTRRRGKTESLNSALNHASGEIIVVSDADCFWPSDILYKALPFLSDPSIGAVTGLEILLNPGETWVTETETLYNNMVHIIRIGESKFHSTIFFQGGFGAYKRSLLDQFDAKADDSGTALNIVQKGLRALLLPEAVYFTTFPNKWKGKIATKLRRGSQLVQIWFRCLKLFSSGKLVLPKRVFVPEAFLYLINPFIFLIIVATSVLAIQENPILLLILLGFLLAAFFSNKLRIILAEAVQDQVILLGAILSSAFKDKFSLWTSVGASRACLTREMLENKHLV